MKIVTKIVDHKTGSISIKQGNEGIYKPNLLELGIKLNPRNKRIKEEYGKIGNPNITIFGIPFFFSSNKKASEFYDGLMADIDMIKRDTK